MRTGINPKVIKEIRELAQRHEIQKVLLFAALARRDYERARDIPLALTVGDYLQFALDVEEEQSRLLMYDIVNLDGAVNEELRQSIQREGIVVYEKI